MVLRWVFVLIAASLGLSGCVTTSEMPLAKNVYALHTSARGLLSAGQADQATLKRAAEITLAHGYTHFILQNPLSQSSTEYMGSLPGTAQTTVTSVGNTAYGTTTYQPGTPIMVPRRNVDVTVVMFHANEPQAAQALDASAILKQANS